jgi:hypothetical protein
VSPRPGYDPGSLVAGLLVIALGGLLLADQLDAIDLHWDYFLPAVLAVVGGSLLAYGLAGPRGGG